MSNQNPAEFLYVHIYFLHADIAFNCVYLFYVGYILLIGYDDLFEDPIVLHLNLYGIISTYSQSSLSPFK